MPGKVDECRICSSDRFEEVLDMGHIPAVDSFLTAEELREPETFYPLRLLMCEECGFAQLGYVVPPEELFHEEYAYDMSVTDSGKDHFLSMAEELVSEYSEAESALDIGSNTGVLLDGFRENGLEVLGVEPSENVYKRAEQRGVPTVNRFFSSDAANDIHEKHGEFDIITATNVFAHIKDLHDTVNGIKTLLSEDGVFVIETPYLLDLVEKNEFDTIYHEHLSHFSVKPLIRLFKQHDLEIKDIEKQEIHGGSLRVHVCREGQAEQTESVEKFLEKEQKLYGNKTMKEFAERAESNRRELAELVRKLKAEDNEVAAVGAPAKGVTLLNYCGLTRKDVPYVSEKSDLKIGKYVPGIHSEVVTDEELIDRDPDYVLLLPWNFTEGIMSNLEEFDGKFIIPVPEPRIVD